MENWSIGRFILPQTGVGHVYITPVLQCSIAPVLSHEEVDLP
jgi:hypothetical protein